MPKIYKKKNKTLKKGTWYLDYFDENDKRTRESTRFTSKKLAQELLLKRLNDVEEKKHFPERKIKPITFEQFVDNVYLPLHAKPLEHYRDHVEKCKVFKAFFGSRNLTDIPLEEIMWLLNAIGEERKDNTYNNYRNMLSGVFSFAKTMKYVRENLVQSVPLRKIVPRTWVLDVDAQKALLEACSKSAALYLYDMVNFDLHTGLRDFELKKALWTDIMWDKKVIMVVGKEKKLRYVDLDSTALSLLESLKNSSNGSPHIFPFGLDDGPIKSFRRSFNTAVRKAGISHTTFHDVRRTFGANCIRAGVDLVQVQIWLGHESVETTRRHYAFLLDDHGKISVEKINKYFNK